MRTAGREEARPRSGNRAGGGGHGAGAGAEGTDVRGGRAGTRTELPPGDGGMIPADPGTRTLSNP
ncbi:hypothetical protein GCM10010363_67740 [Streptomyces omiyaensis]|nr:hypothetical protein GCM10010363_67740 [Streptomyces omiyaensis]